MNALRVVKKIAFLTEAIWPSLLVIVCISALWSGYLYQYNGDEVLHTQMAYLLSIGKQPFADYFSIYTPIFHWVILPAVALVQMGIQTLHILRIEMLLLYGVELVSLALTLRMLFGVRAAWIGVALLLVDPFTTFAGMQIRPDTLMLALFCMGLVCTIYAQKRGKNALWYAWSGILVGLSTLVAVKIVPAVLPVFIGSCMVLSGKRRWLYCGGFVMPWILFLGYLLSFGLFMPAFRQLTVDIGYLSAAILHPTRFGFFYLPDNVFIYGLAGKPLTWVLVLVLPFFGGLGGLATLVKRTSALGTALVFSMILSFASLCIPTTAFIQYYLPSYWFFALFAGVFLHRVFVWVPKYIQPGMIIAAFLLYGAVSLSAVRGNFIRATMNWDQQDSQFMEYWRRILPESAVFPGYLFRPSVHPLINGYFMGDMPPVVRKQFPPPEVLLDASRVPFIFLNESALMTYEPSTQQYIRTHYVRVPQDEALMTRIP